jgi:tRNA threonylcarbamoyladenosine dehydratase
MDSAPYLSRFSGIGRLYGREALARFSESHVCLFGLGGVGTWAAEALARSGIGRVTIIDLDEICVTNTNRQIHALDETIGRSKVQVMAERMRSISPSIEVNPIEDFYTKKTADALLSSDYDCVIDAIDPTHRKADLIARCVSLKIPMITSGAAGGRRRTEKITRADLNATTHDALLRDVKRLLRRQYNFPRGDAPWGITAVFSTERPVFPTPEGGVCERPQGREALRLDCDAGFGSASFITGAFGFLATSVALELLSQPTHLRGHFS